MSRHFRALRAPSVVVIALSLPVVGACGSTSNASSTPGDAAPDAIANDAGATSSIGSPCIPSAELSPSFAGFNPYTVTVEEGNAACSPGAVCLVNHFQGRASCPYGQDATGAGPPGAQPCSVPGTGALVKPSDSRSGVNPQCADRRAIDTVTCSCRCANPAGKTDDGASYCTCPSGFECSDVVPDFIANDEHAGSYCIPKGTKFDPASACASSCDPKNATCPTPDVHATGIAPGSAPVTYFSTVIRAQTGQCLPEPLPTKSDGEAACDVFVVLAAGDTCGAHAGLTAIPPAVDGAIRESTPGFDATRSICGTSQISAGGGACLTSNSPGWCYLTAPAAPDQCAEAIRFSSATSIPAAASTLLACP